MKVAKLIAQYLLGLAFFVFGLNGFLQFMKPPQPPVGLVAEFQDVMMIKSHYFWLVAACQLLGGLLFLANRYVALGVVILGAVIVNIITFHLAMDPGGIVPGVICGLLLLVVAWSVRGNLAGLFEAKTR